MTALIEVINTTVCSSMNKELLNTSSTEAKDVIKTHFNLRKTDNNQDRMKTKL